MASKLAIYIQWFLEDLIFGRPILSPLRLPISPSGHKVCMRLAFQCLSVARSAAPAIQLMATPVTGSGIHRGSNPDATIQ